MKVKQPTYQNLVLDYDDFVNYMKNLEKVEHTPKSRKKKRKELSRDSLKSVYIKKLSENFHLYFISRKTVATFCWEVGEQYRDQFLHRNGINHWAEVLNELRRKTTDPNLKSTLFLCADKELIDQLTSLQMATCQLPMSPRETVSTATYHCEDLSSVLHYKRTVEDVFTPQETPREYVSILGTSTAIRTWHQYSSTEKIKHLYVTTRDGRDFRSMVIRHSDPSEQILAVSFDQEDLVLAHAYQLDTCFLNKGNNDQLDISPTYEKKIVFQKRKLAIDKSEKSL